MVLWRGRSIAAFLWMLPKSLASNSYAARAVLDAWQLSTFWKIVSVWRALLWALHTVELQVLTDGLMCLSTVRDRWTCPEMARASKCFEPTGTSTFDSSTFWAVNGNLPRKTYTPLLHRLHHPWLVPVQVRQSLHKNAPHNDDSKTVTRRRVSPLVSVRGQMVVVTLFRKWRWREPPTSCASGSWDSELLADMLMCRWEQSNGETS